MHLLYLKFLGEWPHLADRMAVVLVKWTMAGSVCWSSTWSTYWARISPQHRTHNYAISILKNVVGVAFLVDPILFTERAVPRKLPIHIGIHAKQLRKARRGNPCATVPHWPCRDCRIVDAIDGLLSVEFRAWWHLGRTSILRPLELVSISLHMLLVWLQQIGRKLDVSLSDTL